MLMISTRVFNFVLSSVLLTAGAAQAGTVIQQTNQSTDVQALSASVDVQHRDSDENACAPISIRVVLKNIAYNSPVFKGIGFYSNFNINGTQSPFTAKEDLEFSQPATLKDGEAASVFTFQAKGWCFEGDETSSESQQDMFKPYAKYEYTDSNGADVRITNWENAPNRIIGMQAEPFGKIQLDFDRSGELLK